MKKVLIVSPVVCAPAFAGNAVRIRQFVNALNAQGVAVYFVLFCIPEIADRKQSNLMEMEFGDKFFLLNKGEKIKGTILNRTLALLKRLGLHKFKLGQDTTLPWSLFTKQTLNEFKQVVDVVNPDLVIGEYVLSAPLISSLNRKIPTAVDTHDCFTFRNEKIRSTNGVGFWWSLSERQERNLLSCFDHVIAIQKSEGEFFKKLLEGKPSKVMTIDVLELPEHWGGEAIRSNPVIGFIGSNNNHNREGLTKFLNLHWPRIIEQHPEAKFLIAGDVKVETVNSSLVVLGRVEHLYADFYSKCTVTVNPCGSGSGLKIKTVESMSYGIPIITTKEGLSGIEQAIGHGAYCADLDGEEFSRSCLTVISSGNLSGEGEKARSFIEQCKMESMKKVSGLFL